MLKLIKTFIERHGAILIRIGVVGGMLCMLPAIGYLAARPKLGPLVLVAIVAAAAAFVIVERVELGLVGMLLAGVFVRFRLPTGTASEIVMSLLLCGAVLGLWVVRMMAIDKRLSLKPAPTNFPLLAFMAVVCISLIWGRAFRDALVNDIGSPFVAVASAAVMVLLPTTLLLVANLIRDIRWLHAIVWVFLGEGLVTLALSLFMDSSIGPAYRIRYLVYNNRLVWINTQGLYSMWYLAFALAMVFFNRKLHWAWRAALLAYAGGWIYWGFWLRTSWLSGWVPAFAAAGAIAFLRSKQLFIVALVIIVVGAGGYYWKNSLEAESEESGRTRLAAYEVNWRITSKHLLFGVGPAGYAAYYMSYFPAEGMATHSNYIDIISQTGIVGTFFLLWFFGAQLWSNYRLQQRLKNRGDLAESLSAAVFGGTAGCVVAMALGDWLFPFAYTQGIVAFDSAMFNWFFMGTIWALSYILFGEQSTSGGDYRTAGEAAL